MSTFRRAAALAFLSLAGAGFIPLFGGPGYEAALAAGVSLPAIAAIATALTVREEKLGALAAYQRGLATGAALAAMGLVVSFLHGFRVGFCDALEGTELFVLGPGVGAV